MKDESIMSENQTVTQEVLDFQTKVATLRQEIGRVIVGQKEVVDGVIACLLAGSHALLEGVPGLGKTMLVRTLAQAVRLDFSRIQFTPDLMPADIIGTTVIDESANAGKVFEFRKGPIFSHIVLADEVNRATPKTQSALLEAMQEHRVTVGRTTYTIEEPYLVMATQNPLEMEGTYPLPEAQLDRFFYKLAVTFPSREELHSIVDRTTTLHEAEVKAVLEREEILGMQKLVRQVAVARHVQDYAVRLLQATHVQTGKAFDKVQRFVRTGASPRGLQAMLLGAKIQALFDGRFAPGIEDIRSVAPLALRHRILLNFEGEAEGVTTDDVIEQILSQLPESA